MLTHNLGFPRIGANRELKKACEKYWAGTIPITDLEEAGRQERHKNWEEQMNAGIDLIPCNDFSFYDQMADTTMMLGALPERYLEFAKKHSTIDTYFAMCRGYQKEGFDIPAMEMTKWFDTNYHYIVPEFTRDMTFKLDSSKIVDEFKEATKLIGNAKPVIIGPLSYLLMGKEKEEYFYRLDLLEKIIPLYIELLQLLEDSGCEYVQFDEPCLATDLDTMALLAYSSAYSEILKNSNSIKIVLATYFGSIEDNVSALKNYPFYAIHIDVVRNPEQIKPVVSTLHPETKLSLGIVDGRNIWKNNFEDSLELLYQAINYLSLEQVLIAPSCSLLHCPYNIENESDTKSLPEDIKSWMAFAKQKLFELHNLRNIATGIITPEESRFALLENIKLHHNRTNSPLVVNEQVRKEMQSVLNADIKRNSAFPEREKIQSKKFNFVPFTTTTIGSFPQTKELRTKRRLYKAGEISLTDYNSFIKKEIQDVIKWQDNIGIDVLVHGEFERNDMVEYFGEQLNGIAFTQNGWVQSYGSRGVKPPIIFGDVSRQKPMTLDWALYAQSLTKKKVKGMLTGPITILQWSFVRNDQPRKHTALQIANAINKEVLDLEKAGIDIIQIDEAAFREGLPIRKKYQSEYLDWAVKAFRVCYKNVKDDTQIHTHMCYSEFNTIIEAIIALDADVISIETSRSQMELLDAFEKEAYPNAIGPGVYDIHSPRIPSVNEMEELLSKAKEKIPARRLWVNPDCGLKTRKWEEVKPAIENMVKASLGKRTSLNRNSMTVL